MPSRAFPKVDVIEKVIHREPWDASSCWLREDEVYGRHAEVTPDDLARFYFEGKVIIIRQVPSDVLWCWADWKELVERVRLRRRG